MSKPTLLSKVQGCFGGVFCGDGLGMSAEKMTRKEILVATNGAGITGFIDPINNREWSKPFKAGDTTDDWQLTSVVNRSYIRMEGFFDIHDMANEHVEALATSTFGWGGTTQKAIEEIRDGKRDPTVPARNYGPNTGMGNAIIMKMWAIPLYRALVRDITSKNLLNNILRLGSLTHHDIRASITAYAVARYLFGMFYEPITTREEGLHILAHVVEASKFPQSWRDEESPTQRLIRLFKPGVLDSSENLEAAVGCGFNCLETMAFTLGTFIRHPTDFRAGVLEAVNAGGDTDTNAAIVGALIGANCGLECIPEEWRTFNPKFQEALDQGEQLYNLSKEERL